MNIHAEEAAKSEETEQEAKTQPEETSEETTSAEAMNDIYDGFRYTSDGSEITIEGYEDQNAESIVIPAEIDGLPVTGIGTSAFEYYYSLTSITIPDTVRSIRRYAFRGCESLTALTLPEGLISIGANAFESCSALASITIPEGAASIDEYAFLFCGNLDSVTIPASVAEFGTGVFYKCTALKTAGPAGSGSNIEFGWTESIPACAFSDSGLTSITIPDSVTSIGREAFMGCGNLTGITIPDGVTSIGNYAFDSCAGLTGITIPSSVTSIGDQAFGYYYGSLAEGFTITGYSCSAAETYANENGIPFIAVSENIITDESVSEITEQTYTGNAITPAVTVTVNGTTLTAGTDYSVSYANNTNAGTASVTVTGIGDYTGTVTKEFTINPKSVTPDVTLSATSYTYDGKAKKPGVTVKDGSKTLTEGTDYKVTYASGRTDAGTYNVKVTLQGNYSGSKKVSFTINKAPQTVTATAASPIYAGKATTITVSGNQGTVTYSSSDTSIATVTKAGKVTGKKAGTVTISAVSAATDNYKQKTVKVTVKVIAMPAATSKAAAANKAGGINVAWKKVSGATGYKIYRNDKLAKTITDVNTLSWGDTKATTNGTKYVYKVAAYTDAGISDNSASVTIYRLDRPAISSLTNSAAGRMTVKWGKNAKATGYQVQYSTTSTFDSYKTVTITSNTTVSKVIASLTKGTTYYVRIRSYKKVNSVNYYSMWSVVKKLKITK